MSPVLMVLALTLATLGEVDTELPERIVDNLADAISEYYAYEGCEAWLVESLQQRLERGAYAERGAQELGQTLTDDLRRWTGDKHFMVGYLPALSEELEGAEVSDPIRVPDKDSAQEREQDFGIRRAEMLDEQIGLIHLDQIAFSPSTVKAFQRALMSLPRANALILDLRDNHGGSGVTVARLLSCFFSREKAIRVAEFFWRPTGETTVVETDPELEGGRYYGHPVLILTSANTRSAAEALAYHLRAFGRALVIGERTSGGAHPADMVSLGDGFVALVPMGLITSARTGTDWEGSGVPIDVPCAAVHAERVAHELAKDLLAQGK